MQIAVVVISISIKMSCVVFTCQEMSRADKWMKMIKDPKKFFPPGAKNR
jgi:hypothetical protein